MVFVPTQALLSVGLKFWLNNHNPVTHQSKSLSNAQTKKFVRHTTHASIFSPAISHITILILVLA
jgi:thiamine pyrophosphokinase